MPGDDRPDEEPGGHPAAPGQPGTSGLPAGQWPPSLGTVLREWGRIGCTGFGGPPAHIRLLRELCVERRKWIDAAEFEDAIATCNMLPGPASTQLAIFCAWRVRGRPGALAGGAAFIVPGLILILGLSALFLSTSPPLWVVGAGAGAGAAVPGVALQAGGSLLGPSWRRRKQSARWIVFLLAGAAAAATIGEWLVLILAGCGLIELAAQRAVRAARTERDAGPDDAREAGRGDARGAGPGDAPGAGPGDAPDAGPGTGPGDASGRDGPGVRGAMAAPLLVGGAVTGGVLLSVTWVAFKVGALSYGGGFVIVPLMQTDAVSHYHWMTGGQFLNAVALGQVTPGPVVLTVGVIGYAAAKLAGGLLAVFVAFTPSFVFVLAGARHFGRLRQDPRARAFLEGAGPVAIGAILGSAISLARALSEPWQYAVLGAAVIALLPLRRGVVLTLLCAGAVGTILALAGAPIPS